MFNLLHSRGSSRLAVNLWARSMRGRRKKEAVRERRRDRGEGERRESPFFEMGEDPLGVGRERRASRREGAGALSRRNVLPQFLRYRDFSKTFGFPIREKRGGKGGGEERTHGGRRGEKRPREEGRVDDNNHGVKRLLLILSVSWGK